MADKLRPYLFGCITGIVLYATTEYFYDNYFVNETRKNTINFDGYNSSDKLNDELIIEFRFKPEIDNINNFGDNLFNKIRCLNCHENNEVNLINRT